MGYAMRTRRYRYIEWVNFTNIVDDKLQEFAQRVVDVVHSV